MEKGQILDLTIEDMSQEGKGIGKADGFAVFVDGAVVGDKVRVQLRKVKKRYGFGELIETLEESPERIESFCARHGECGGCPYGQLSYAAQLALKEKQVRDKLERLGGVADPVVYPIMAMDEPFRYRNKASMPVSTGGLITLKGGIARPVHEPRVGFFGARSHEVADCSDCWLQSEPAMAAAAALRQFMVEDHITSYDPRWEKGLMRHMIVRTAAGTGEVMVILVINGKAIPNAQKLVEMLDEAIYNVPVYDDGPMAGVEFSLESVVINVNKSKNLEGPILGEECITIAGKPTITEEVSGMKFEISPLSFYQVNREQMVKLYDKVLEYADLKGGETVLDLYCGVGTIGLFCAREMEKKARESAAEAAEAGAAATDAEGIADKVKPGQVIGIESIKGAVLDANRNATINGIVNARYVCGKAEEELPKMMVQADVAILDPPRAGCDERLLEAVVKAEPEKIIYVSCDPATLARDIRWLTENGYEFREATPCDMFPWTGHVETCVLLSHKSADDFISVKMEYADDRKIQPDRITYRLIQEYIEEKYGFKVHTANIAEVKRNLGLPMYDAPNAVEELKRPYKPAPEYKVEAIKDALRHFKVID